MPLYSFLISCLLAFIAGHMVNYSIIFLALEWFDSSALAGIGYGLCFGPPLILGWFAGAYCDRYSPRKVLLVAQNSFFISIAILAFAANSELAIRQSLLLMAALFSGIGWSFVAPARFATLPYYVKGKKLAGASIALNLMVMSGFGLAPMLLQQVKVNFDWQAVFMCAGALFALSSLILIPLKIAHQAKVTQGVFKEVAHTLEIVKASSLTAPFLVLAMVTYLLMGPMQVLLPSIAKNQLGLSEIAQGYYLSLIAIALIVGGVIAMGIKDKGHLGKTLMFAIFIAGSGVAYLGVTEQLAFSVITLLISGACGGIAVSFIVAGLQHYSPEFHRGRIMSFYSIISQCVPALSGILAGGIAQVYSPSIALQVMALIIVLSALSCFYLLTAIRQLQGFEHA
ncbi:MFS transporter [Thalassotalea sp. G2M2-11]|uniref:MFS transporter n=1 Tax=Thalassotalea sp. G2M2-11 TaxID=2787627 RepID=UPI0019D15866|nr:MFS transporter [Thalassotalea sp. G2M2-11]